MSRPPVGECADAGRSAGVGDCDTVSLYQSPVYEATHYSAVRIHRLYCHYEDGALITGADEITWCVGSSIDGTQANTSTCVTWDHVDDNADSDNDVESTVVSDVASTAFGLILRVSAVTDVGSSFNGSCEVEFSGAN